MKAHPRLEHAYAIVRVDLFQGADVALENKVTVKVVLRDANAARREVERLNQLNAGKGAVYFAQVTRLESEVPATAAGSADAGQAGAETTSAQ